MIITNDDLSRIEVKLAPVSKKYVSLDVVDGADYSAYIHLNRTKVMKLILTLIDMEKEMVD